MMTTTKGLPYTGRVQAARGYRDNAVCALMWFIQMIIREGRHAVITVILTTASAEFDTESQMFLDEDRRGKSRSSFLSFHQESCPLNCALPMPGTADGDVVSRCQVLGESRQCSSWGRPVDVAWSA